MTSDGMERARLLRLQQTKAESLLWSVLRAKQLCGLKFRRQHPVGPFFADFGCESQKFVVEIDGGYHDHTHAKDRARQNYLQSLGWSVLRFTNEEVLDDVGAVAIAIARHVKLDAEFIRRKGGVSGMYSAKKTKKRTPSPGPDGPTSPPGRGDQISE